MAKGSRNRGRRGSRNGGSAYIKASSENISVLRIYARDNTSLNFDQMTAEDIRGALGLSGSRDFYFRLIAVCFAGNNSSTDAGGRNGGSVVLEFAAGGTSYSITNNAPKPARIRVPRSNLAVGQYWHHIAGGDTVPTLTGQLDADSTIFTVGDGTAVGLATRFVQFIDVAFRY